MDITRKRFLASLAGSTMAVLVPGCGGGGGYSGTPVAATPPAPSPPSPAAACGSSGAAISGNHGHQLVVPPADLDATTNMVYNIQGVSDHNHTVTLTPAQLTQLKTPGMTVTVASSNNGHVHDVTVTCT